MSISEKIEKHLAEEEAANNKSEQPSAEKSEALKITLSKEPEINQDYVVTLDIDGKNRRFREKANVFKNFWDNAKSLVSSQKKKAPSGSIYGNLSSRIESVLNAEVNLDSKSESIEKKREELKSIANEVLQAEKLKGAEKLSEKELNKPLSNVAEALDIFQPLLDKSKNQALAEAFQKGTASPEQFSEASSAFEAYMRQLRIDTEGNSKKIEQVSKVQELLVSQKGEKKLKSSEIAAYKNLAELIDIYQPFVIKSENSKLAAILETGVLESQDIESAGKAMTQIIAELKKNPIANASKIEHAQKINTEIFGRKKLSAFPVSRGRKRKFSKAA